MTIMKFLTSIKKEFDMNSIKSCVFHHSQWESCTDGEHASLYYCIYRIIYMGILILGKFISLTCQWYLYPIFLTNWSFTIQVIYAVLFCCNTLWKKHAFLSQKVRMKCKSVDQESHSSLDKKQYEMKEVNDDMTDVIANDRNGSGSSGGVECKNKNSDLPVEEEKQFNPVIETIMTTDIAAAAVKKPETDATLTINKNNINLINNVPSGVEKLIWILMNISHVLPHVVAFGYWVFVYEFDPKQSACEKFKSHYIAHSGTSILALIDSLVVAVPVRFTHFIFPASVFMVFSLFSYIYEISGGSYRKGKDAIYSILNWRRNPERAIVVVIIGILISPILHLITCWGVHYIRLKLASLYNKKRNRK